MVLKIGDCGSSVEVIEISQATVEEALWIFAGGRMSHVLETTCILVSILRKEECEMVICCALAR